MDPWAFGECWLGYGEDIFGQPWEDIRQWILSCDAYSSRRTDRLKKLKMVKYQIGAPMEIPNSAMDIMGPLPRTSKGNKYVLVVGDYFTKWIGAYCLPNQEAKTIADSGIHS